MLVAALLLKCLVHKQADANVVELFLCVDK